MEIIATTAHYLISFPFRPHLVQAVKGLPGRRFDYQSKAWTVPLREKESIEAFAAKYGFQMIDQAAQPTEPEVIWQTPELPKGDIDTSFLKVTPYPFQKVGIEYATEKKRLIIGDQPGLGKTMQAMGTVTALDAFPCLVICPASLRENWRREWEKFTGKKALILSDAVKRNYQFYHSSGMVQVFITNYESLKKYFVADIKKDKQGGFRLNNVEFRQTIRMFKSIVIDELHRCKSSQTQQSKFVKGLTKDKEVIIGLTGTPVVNKPRDLISQLSIIERLSTDFGGWKQFTQRYCAGTNEASNLQELNARLRSTCFIRREKHEVLTDLPAKQRQVVICEIDNRKEYVDAENDLVKYLREYKQATDRQIIRSMKGEIMVRIGILKNISARGKLKSVFEFVSDMLESGEKLVLFIHLKEVAEAVKAKYPGAVTITGADNSEARQRAIDSFQRDPDTKLIICSIKAAGVGITLTASSRVGFIELPWTFADCEQCEDRTHRIGQKDSVTAYYFLGENTIDEKIYQIIQAKKVVAQAVTGSTEEIPESIVDMIVNLFNQQKTN